MPSTVHQANHVGSHPTGTLQPRVSTQALSPPANGLPGYIPGGPLPLRPAHDERAVDLGIGPHRLDRAIDNGPSILLPHMAAPTAGGVVERNDLELLFREQAEKEEGREPGGDGQRPPAPASAPFQLYPSPKIRRVDPDRCCQLNEGRSQLNV